MTIFGITLLFLRNYKKISREDLSKDTGISLSMIENIEFGYIEPAPQIADKIAQYFGVSTDYMTGRVSFINKDGNAELSTPALLPKGYYSVNVYNPFSFEKGVLYEKEVLERVVLESRDVDGDYVAMRVTNDDMNKARIYSGDTVIIKVQSSARDGEIVVVKLEDGTVCIRRIFRKGSEVKLFAECLGKKLPVIEYKLSNDRYKIIGKVERCIADIK